jgi:hypothetical protein
MAEFDASESRTRTYNWHQVADSLKKVLAEKVRISDSRASKILELATALESAAAGDRASMLEAFNAAFHEAHKAECPYVSTLKMVQILCIEKFNQIKPWIVADLPNHPEFHEVPRRPWGSEAEINTFLTDVFVANYPAFRRILFAGLSPAVIRTVTRPVNETDARPPSSQPSKAVGQTWQSIFSGTPLDGVSLEDAPALAKKLEEKDPGWRRRYVTLVETALYPSERNQLLVTLLIAVVCSKTIRKRLVKDFDFLDLLAVRVCNACLLCKLQIPGPGSPVSGTGLETNRSIFQEGADSVNRWLKIFVTVINEDPRSWRA